MPTTGYAVGGEGGEETNFIEYTDFTKAIDVSKNYIISGQKLFNLANAVRHNIDSNSSLTFDQIITSFVDRPSFTSLVRTDYFFPLTDIVDPDTNEIITSRADIEEIKLQVTIPDDNWYIIGGWGHCTGNSYTYPSGLIMRSTQISAFMHSNISKTNFLILGTFSSYDDFQTVYPPPGENATSYESWEYAKMSSALMGSPQGLMVIKSLSPSGGVITLSYWWPSEAGQLTQIRDGSLYCGIYGPQSLSNNIVALNANDHIIQKPTA